MKNRNPNNNASALSRRDVTSLVLKNFHPRTVKSRDDAERFRPPLLLVLKECLSFVGIPRQQKI